MDANLKVYIQKAIAPDTKLPLQEFMRGKSGESARFVKKPTGDSFEK